MRERGRGSVACSATLDAPPASSGPHFPLLSQVPAWVTRRWLATLSKEYPTLAFHASVSSPFGKGSLLGLLRQLARLRSDKKYISVGFVGYPNVGKSSVINTLRTKKATRVFRWGCGGSGRLGEGQALLPRSNAATLRGRQGCPDPLLTPPPPAPSPSTRAPPPPRPRPQVCNVAPVPGETKVWQYITLTKRVFLIDCPGVVYNKTADTDTDAVLKGVVRVENLADAAEHVGAVLARVRPEYIVRDGMGLRGVGRGLGGL